MANIAAVHYSYYPFDPRPRREAEALADAGMAVDVICLRLPEQPACETVDGVTVHRLSLIKNRGGKLSYIAQYLCFILLAAGKLSRLHLHKRFAVVHIHNMPDVLVFAALLPKLGGSRIILDLHDPMPELYMTKYRLAAGSPVIRLLKVLERWSIAFADLVLTPNISFRQLFVSRGCPESKIHIVMNSPTDKIFPSGRGEAAPAAAKRDGPFVIMFHGGVHERHGLDTALEAIALLRPELPQIVFRVFGDGEYTERFLQLVDQYDLRETVTFFGPVPLERIAREIETIDVGLIPNRKSPFTDLNLPVRIFEYLSLGKPVIVPPTRGILDYFDETSLFFFEPGDAASLARTIRHLHQEPATAQERTKRGGRICARYSWASQRQTFLGLVAAMTGGLNRETI